MLVSAAKLNPNFPLQNAYSYPLTTHTAPPLLPKSLPHVFILICGYLSSISSCVLIYFQKKKNTLSLSVAFFMSIYLFLMVGRGLHSSLTIWCIMTLFGYWGVFCE